jgi:hypothetical protein
MYACNPVKKLGKDAILLNSNKIECDRKEIISELYPILKQKPNRRLLGMFRFHLGVHTLFSQLKPSRLNNWIKNTIGEEPVLYDSALTRTTTEQLRQYMENIGYFNAQVTDTVLFPKRWKANVRYRVKSGTPYRLRQVFYVIEDSLIRQIVLSDTPNCLLKANQNYDLENFKKERERINHLLRNRGYYFFNQLFISFRIDSALKNHQVDVYTHISNPPPTADTLLADAYHHRPYHINQIYIRSDFDPSAPPAYYVQADTLEFRNRYFITRTAKKNFRPAALSNHIFFRRDSLYSLVNHESAYRSLADINNFRFVNITFQKDTLRKEEGRHFINAFFNLTPLPKQAYRIEVEGTHNGGNLGTALNLVYINRNTFRGAEVSEFRIKTAFEDQKQFTGSEQRILWFNTWDIGPEFILRIPRIFPIWPFSRIIPRYRIATPVTAFAASYSLQQRPEFFKRFAGFSAGLTVRRKRTVSHQISPAEINIVNVNPASEFKRKLETIGDPALTASYGNYLITNGRYTLIINTQQAERLSSFFFLRFNIELAGNSLRLIDHLTGRIKSKEEISRILKTEYAQYIRPDVDVRFYHVLNENNSLVYRLYAGMGKPYLNSKSLPFEKSFFAGGANDLRAFNARSVGPGSFEMEEKIQQSGEIKLNANLEYRFDMIRVLEGALFVDAGNVWLFKEDPNRPGSQFQGQDFLSEIAVGGGFGLRFNFNYFVFRIDVGYKLRDPRRPADERWVYKKLQWQDGIGNFAIGYPF